MNNKAAAFFDFDLTVSNYDSFKSFLFFIYFKYPKNYIFWPYLLTTLFLKKLNFISLYEAKKRMLIALKNLDRQNIESIADNYIAKYMNSLLNVNAIHEIEKYKEKHIPVYILTSSPNIIFNPLKNKLNITRVYANELEFIDNKFSGNFIGEDCFGENKANLIKNIALDNNYNLQNCFAYTDHHSDIPMLEIIGNAFVVNPTNKLKKYASDNQLQIFEWFENV